MTKIVTSEYCSAKNNDYKESDDKLRKQLIEFFKKIWHLST